MGSEVRVRHHTDGHYAVSTTPHLWRILDVAQSSVWATEDDVSGEGWSELLVTELPEPDGWLGDATAFNSEPECDVPFWNVTDGQMHAEDGNVFIDDVSDAPLDVFKSDALKMLAAVAACEHHRAQQ